ncbi:hypothetical protein HDU83_002650 [Entophlyctis luteolus]|nr:hypothetical protein HDU83_002650 [Entophlyctis luteolus]
MEPHATTDIGHVDAPKARRRKGKRSTGGSVNVSNMPTRPAPQASRIWVDDPNWKVTVVPAGWSCMEPVPLESILGPDDCLDEIEIEYESETWTANERQIKSLLRDANNRQPAHALSQAHSSAVPVGGCKWDSPVVGVQFLPEPEGVSGSHTTDFGHWIHRGFDTSNLREAKARLDELD